MNDKVDQKVVLNSDAEVGANAKQQSQAQAATGTGSEQSVVEQSIVEHAKTEPGNVTQSNQPPPQPKSETKTETKTQSENKSSRLLTLVWLLILVGLGGSAYAHWWQYRHTLQQDAAFERETQQLSQRLTQQSSELDQGLSEVQSNIVQQADTNQQFQQSQQQQQRNHDQLVQQLEAQNQRLLKLSSVNSQNWELTEALYLIRLAGQRLGMENNREAALALLQGAEEIIGRQQNPALFTVRETISNDIAALKVVEATDKEGLFLQLSAIIRQMQNLPLGENLNFERQADELPAPTSILTPTATPAPTENTGLWRDIIDSFQLTFSQLKTYVRKTELQTPIKPRLLPEQQQQLRLSVSLMLESAQLALLRDQALVFNNALAEAQHQLLDYYPESNQRRELILALESLRSETINPTFPDISQSYRQLNDFLQRQALAPSAEDPIP